MASAYIETPRPTQRALQLVETYGAVWIHEPARFDEIPKDQSLICVIENVHFDAAGVVLTAEDFREYKYDNSGRPRTWLTLPKATVRPLIPLAYRDWL